MITSEQHREIEARLERNRKPVRDGECLTCHGRRIIIPMGYSGAPVDCPTCVIPADTGVEDEIRDLHKPIIEYCRDNCWIYFYSNPMRKTGRTIGENDFHILADRSRVFHIECKARGQELSPGQAILKDAAFHLGHIIHVIYTMEQFYELVNTPSGLGCK